MTLQSQINVDAPMYSKWSNERKVEKFHTDKELAKKSDVGTGTVAKYDAIMKSNDEDLKHKFSIRNYLYLAVQIFIHIQNTYNTSLGNPLSDEK